MLVVGGHRFALIDDEVYIVGSASNDYYRYIKSYMGDVTVLGWTINIPKEDCSKYEKFDENIGCELTLYPSKYNIIEKCRVIKNEVEKHDLIYVKMPLYQSIIGCHFALKFRKKFILESGGGCFESLWYHGGIAYKLAAFPLDILVKYYHKKAKYIVYVSEQYLQEKYPSKAKQMGCSDAIVTIPEEKVLNDRIERINNHYGAYVVGLIGATQAEYRGHDRLIRAARLIVDKGYDIKIRFLGGGTKDKKRRRLAFRLGVDNRVEFCGRIPHSQVDKWIDGVDILAMPTRVEGISRSIIEAMSRGCPVIGTLETGIREQIMEDCLIHYNDVNALARLIMRMIDDKEFMVKCCNDNYERSLKYSSIETSSRRKKFYKEFMESTEMY